jgi:hypothetical protein
MPRAADAIAWLAQRGRIPASGLDAADAERGLRQDMIGVVCKLLRFCRGDSRDLLAYFLYYYDLLNVEAVIYALDSGGEDIAAPPLYDTGRSGLLRREALASASSFPVLGALLRGTPLHGPFRSAFPVYEETSDAPTFVASIERAFLELWKAAAARCGQVGEDARDGSLFLTFLEGTVTDTASRLQARGCRPHLVDEWLAMVPRAGRRRPGRPPRRAVQPAKEGGAEPPTSIWGGQRVGDAAWRTQRRMALDVQFLLGFLFLRLQETERLVALIESKDLGLSADEAASYVKVPA